MYLCHRGISDYYPENTVGSIFEVTKNNIYSGVEFDIQLTKDNKWIIYHDDNLLRLNNIENDVSNINFNEINKINWKNNKFNVSLLSDLFEKKFNTNFIFNIEIKSKLSNVPEISIKELFSLLSNFNNKIFISSFDHDWFDKINPYFEFACISEDEAPSKGNFWILHHSLIKSLDVIDIIERNIKIGIHGKKLIESSIDDSSIVEYQIVDHKENTIIYINGVFDILNKNHIKLLQKAKEYGDYLIVGIFDDYYCESNFRSTINSAEDRKIILDNLKIVDKTISPAPINISQSFIQENDIDLVIHFGSIDNYKENYEFANKTDILKIENLKNENIFTLEIINKIFSFY